MSVVAPAGGCGQRSTRSSKRRERDRHRAGRDVTSREAGNRGRGMSHEPERHQAAVPHGDTDGVTDDRVPRPGCGVLGRVEAQHDGGPEAGKQPRSVEHEADGAGDRQRDQAQERGIQARAERVGTGLHRRHAGPSAAMRACGAACFILVSSQRT